MTVRSQQLFKGLFGGADAVSTARYTTPSGFRTIVKTVICVAGAAGATGKSMSIGQSGFANATGFLLQNRTFTPNEVLIFEDIWTVLLPDQIIFGGTNVGGAETIAVTISGAELQLP